MRILFLAFLLSSASLFAQTRLVDFQKLEVDSSGLPLTQEAQEVPLTKPTSFAFDERATLAKVRLIPGENADTGMTISVEPGQKVSGHAHLRWGPDRMHWNRGPLRIRYWMVPRQTDQQGGNFCMNFHKSKDDSPQNKSIGLLGTYFSKAAKIELLGVDAPGQPYLTDSKYDFDWIVDFAERTASLSLNGEQWIKDAPLPEHWLTDRLFAYVFAGQLAGGGVDAEWDFGGLVVEEIQENVNPE
jgi:hypothetical protein